MDDHGEDWHHRCDIPACNCGRCHQCGEDMPEVCPWCCLAPCICDKQE
jgi:hypothetical protein